MAAGPDEAVRLAANEVSPNFPADAAVAGGAPGDPRAPLHFKLNLVMRDGDLFCHQLELSVPAAPETAMLATMSSEGYAFPTVLHVPRRGSLPMRRWARNRLLTGIFEVLVRTMLRWDGTRITLLMGDARAWIRGRLADRETEGEALIAAIVAAAPPGRRFEDVCVVDID